MKRFRAFVKKEFQHIFRDYRTMMILFVMPVAQVLIFGYVISNDISDAQIGILDKSKDEVSTQIIYKLTASGYFLPTRYYDSASEIESSFRSGEIKMAIVFEPEFGGNLERLNKANIQLIADASDVNTARLLSNYAEGIIRRFQDEYNQGQGAKMMIVPEARMFYNENLEGIYMSVPGIMAMILILVSAMMTSITITREKEYGSMEVLLISPLTPAQIILGKVTPYVFLAFINAISVLVIGVFIFRMPMNGSLILLLAECFLYIIMALSLGIFISSMAKNQMVAMFISMFALMLPTILLSGFIFPVANMPLPLRILSNLMPPKWFILIVKDIMLKGGGIALVWKETLVLCGFIALFVGLSIKKFKVRIA